MKKFDRTKPYNQLPKLPPRVDVESIAILRKVITASRALAHLNSTLSNLPNPNLLLDTIHLKEAKASSEIENIITTNDELFRTFIVDLKIDHNPTKEVINYKKALWIGLEKIKSKPFITTNLCIEIMQCIVQNKSSIRNTPGTTLANPRGEIMYTPPTGADVIKEKMTLLEKFINKEDSLDPLIKMALLHYQFEAIHPFADGNGRTGRILLLIYLKLSGLLDIPAIFLSEYIMMNKKNYYTYLRNVTEKGDWESWILYMLDMIEVTAKNGVEQINHINKQMEKTAKIIKSKLPKIYSWELVEVLFKLPYTKRLHLTQSKLGNAKTVGNYLHELEAIKVLKSVKIGKERLYLNHKLMEILEKG